MSSFHFSRAVFRPSRPDRIINYRIIMKMPTKRQLANLIVSVLLISFASIALVTVNIGGEVVEMQGRQDSASKVDSLDVVDRTPPTPTNAGTVDCRPGRPCTYQDVVDLRVIVMTFSRSASLRTLLQSLQDLELDGDRAALEIWIDVDRSSGRADASTIAVARAFNWTRGPTRVHVHPKHIGIYGQWIDTWRPRQVPPSEAADLDQREELALFLEDDLSVSPFAYRWLRAVYRTYGHRADYAGATLVSDDAQTLQSFGPRRRLKGPATDTVFMYPCMGSWGFAPQPRHWRLFQDWYHSHQSRLDFQPRVPGTLPSDWYEIFQRTGRAHTMWTIWFIYYAASEQIHTVYSNLVAYTRNNQTCLSINRKEIGLHQFRKGTSDAYGLLRHWKDEYARFPRSIAKLNWAGFAAKSKRKY